jgi:hypothetical protein
MDDIKAAEILKSLAADSLESRTRQARLVKHGRLEAEQAPAARIR